MKKGDLYILLIALTVMAFLGIGYKLYLNSLGDDRYVNVYVDNKLEHSIKLTADTNMEIPMETDHGYNLIRIYNNGVQVIEADCPNQVDVRQGFVKMPGLPIICVPNHLRIVIEGGEENDAISS